MKNRPFILNTTRPETGRVSINAYQEKILESGEYNGVAILDKETGIVVDELSQTEVWYRLQYLHPVEGYKGKWFRYADIDPED